MFLEISQNSQDACETSKNTFPYGTPPVAASKRRSEGARDAFGLSYVESNLHPASRGILKGSFGQQSYKG